MPERDGRNQRPELYAARILCQPGERGPQLQAIPVRTRLIVGEVVGAVQTGIAKIIDRPRQPSPALPAHALLPLDHDRNFDHATAHSEGTPGASSRTPPDSPRG